MTQVAVGKGAGTKIRALVAQTNASIGRATAQALAEEQRRLARTLREYWQQDALEKRLDEIVAQAAKGLTAVIEFGRLPEVQNLVRALSAIRKEMPLYEADDDDRTYVALLYHEKTVEFVISGSRESMVQTVGGMMSFTQCEMSHSFLLVNQKRRFRRAWLRYFFLQNFESHWYDFEVEHDEQEVMRDRSPVNEPDLRNFARIDIRATQAGKWDEDGNWSCNHVLLRFLCDCNDAKKLNQYFERTLAKLK